MIDKTDLINAIIALSTIGIDVIEETDGEIIAYGVRSNNKLKNIELDNLLPMLLDGDEVIELAEDYANFKAQNTTH